MNKKSEAAHFAFAKFYDNLLETRMNEVKGTTIVVDSIQAIRVSEFLRYSLHVITQQLFHQKCLSGALKEYGMSMSLGWFQPPLCDESISYACLYRISTSTREHGANAHAVV